MVLPRPMLSTDLEDWNSLEARISRSQTICGFSLGISTPMAFLPGIGATMRIRLARIAMARSSASPVMRLTLMPGASSIS